MSSTLQQITKLYIDKYPRNVANILSGLSIKKARIILNTFSTVQIENIALNSKVSEFHKIWALLDVKVKIKVLNNLETHQLLYLYTLLPIAEKNKLYFKLSDATKKRIKQFGSLQALELAPKLHPAFSVQDSLRVDQALRKLSVTQNTIYKYIYIVNQDNVLMGIISLRELYSSKKHLILQQVMTRDVACLNIKQLNIIKLKQFFKYYAVCPIVDDNHHFLGIMKSETIDRYLSDTRQDIINQRLAFIYNLLLSASFKLIELLFQVTKRRKTG